MTDMTAEIHDAEVEELRARVAMLTEALVTVMPDCETSDWREKAEAALAATSEDVTKWRAERSGGLELALLAREDEHELLSQHVIAWPGVGDEPRPAFRQALDAMAARVRKAALEEAAKYIELNWTLDRPAMGLTTPSGDRARRMTDGVRALAGPAPETTEAKPACSHEAVTYGDVGWRCDDCGATLVCATCRGTGRLMDSGPPAHWSAPCPACAKPEGA